MSDPPAEPTLDGPLSAMADEHESVACPLCGTRYSEAEGRACRAGCPLQRHCGLLSCPTCAYEMPAPTRLTRWLERTGTRLSAFVARFRRSTSAGDSGESRATHR